MKNIIKGFFLPNRGINSLNFQRLSKLQWENQENLLSIQQYRLRILLEHAYQHVPYYKELFQNTRLIDCSNKLALEYFQEVPKLTKNKIHRHFDVLKSEDLSLRKWATRRSGGSTGEPVKFIQDQHYNQWRRSLKILYDSWTGYKKSDRRINLWGSEADLKQQKPSLIKRLRNWSNNSITLNSFLMTPDRMEQYVGTLNSFRPALILAYAESIYDLARYIEKHGIAVRSPKAIMTSAGILFPHMRKTIQRVFNAPVFNRYGTREVGDIGCECEFHTGFHVSVYTHYIEIMRPDGTIAEPGESGEILVTLLTNYAMPLIRYRLGDMGSWATELCSCNRGLPLLKNIEGRVSGVFLRKDGTRINGIYFTPVLDSQEWIKKFRVIQEAYDAITILIAPYDDILNPEETLQPSKNKIVEDIKLVMGETCKIDFKFVDDLRPTVSGKNIYAISNIFDADIH